MLMILLLNVVILVDVLAATQYMLEHVGVHVWFPGNPLYLWLQRGNTTIKNIWSDNYECKYISKGFAERTQKTGFAWMTIFRIITWRECRNLPHNIFTAQYCFIYLNKRSQYFFLYCCEQLACVYTHTGKVILMVPPLQMSVPTLAADKTKPHSYSIICIKSRNLDQHPLIDAICF